MVPGDTAHNPRSDSCKHYHQVLVLVHANYAISFTHLRGTRNSTACPHFYCNLLTRIFSIGFKETFFLYFVIQKVITTTSGGVSMYCTAGYCQRRHFQSSLLLLKSKTHSIHVFQRHLFEQDTHSFGI